jgi:hypothetical protein
MTDPSVVAPTKERIGYWLALGIFVHQFAQIETTLWLMLSKLAGVNWPTARAVFHGVRSDGARQYINRLLEINADQPTKDDFQFIFTQLGHITDARNSILHYGTAFGDGDEFLSTNNFFALTEERLKSFPVSQKILNQMTTDLKTIGKYLQYYLFRDAPGRSPTRNQDRPPRAAWQYKPPRQASPGGKTRNKAPKQ